MFFFFFFFKVHNIVLYPDKHSWCKTTEIKQIVAHPGCSSIEIDNNVCVGACFSYSIPRTIPSSPGEVIIPYCDSCQPVEYEWREVTLTCSDESEEDEGQTEMTKRVQVITNCSCTTCEKQYEEKKISDHHRPVGSKTNDDVPELMSLMMGVHNKEQEINESEEEDDQQKQQTVDNVNVEIEGVRPDDKENLIKDEDDDDDDDDDGQNNKKNEKEKLKEKLDKESRTLEILHLSNNNNNNEKSNTSSSSSTSSQNKMKDLIEIAKTEHKHYEFGPHHSLILKPDGETFLQSDANNNNNRGKIKKLKNDNDNNDDDDDDVYVSTIEDDEEDDLELEDGSSSSSVINQFKIHDSDKYIDQIAVESIRKEQIENQPKIMTIPDMIYNSTAFKGNGKWRSGVRMFEVPHHHLQPAVEGVELSYYGKSHTKVDKIQDRD
ncbi:conserved hypothetical protein [Pediculus humanus corporis]|uniref:CTCK domain-containing protein n=1 Tax=Pediculus humanus subsp. corporis TaxID=121224 RepID=E0VGW1_PEDHC|nr:uncharacterized protein Phum_PHUM193950 [Pediculus humanus corporis]EEB12617.1 conserved hypothetical protein [Pediculus humanus corporis]